MPRASRRVRNAAVVVAALLTTAGCGTDRTPDAGSTPDGGPISPGTATQPANTSPASASPPPTGSTTLSAALTDFKIGLSPAVFRPGAYVFLAEQRGQRPHALSIKGPGVDTKTTATIQPGGASQGLTVTLQPGVYELWCPVDNHKGQGMSITITVR
jgi:plastocyanin